MSPSAALLHPARRQIDQRLSIAMRAGDVLTLGTMDSA
jgi:hypothetical protein